MEDSISCHGIPKWSLRLASSCRLPYRLHSHHSLHWEPLKLVTGHNLHLPVAVTCCPHLLLPNPVSTRPADVAPGWHPQALSHCTIELAFPRIPQTICWQHKKLLKRCNCCFRNLVQEKIQIQNSSKAIKGQNQILSCLKVLSPQNSQVSRNNHLTSGKATSVTAIYLSRRVTTPQKYFQSCHYTMINAFLRNNLQNFSILDKSILTHGYCNSYPLLNYNKSYTLPYTHTCKGNRKK